MSPLQFKSTPQKVQKSFYDPDVLLEHRPFPADSLYLRFRATCDQLLPDMLFAPLYTGFGRPTISPSLFLRLMLLIIHFNCSDEMAMENLLYDERWLYMCNY